MHPRMLAFALILLPAVVSAEVSRKVRTVQPQTTASSSAVNLVAVHDSRSPGYNRDCLSCHAAVLQETSADPRVPHIHRAMIPYTPGFNPRNGVTSAVCVQCHRSTDMMDGSAAGLRVQVDRTLCALCHGPSGPGKQLYQ